LVQALAKAPRQASTPSINPLHYQAQYLNVGGSLLALMHQPPEAQYTSIKAIKGLQTWQREAFMNRLAEQASSGALLRQQPPFAVGQDAIWLPTVESADIIKAGGLAEVPIGLAKGFLANGLGKPSLVMPLYLGQQKVKGQWINYQLIPCTPTPNQTLFSITTTAPNGQITAQKTFELTPVLTFEVSIAELDRTPEANEVELLKAAPKEVAPVTVELLKATINGVPHLFLHHQETATSRSFFDISCSKAMKAPSPYVGSRFSEIRRFTFFTRALKELQWVLAEHDPTGESTGIALPKVLFLNDWQVGALPALTRYTAYDEAMDRVNRQLAKDSTDATPPLSPTQRQALLARYEGLGHFFAKHQQSNVLVHNFAYQGEHPNHRPGDRQKTEYLYNLLFYKQAAQVMRHAHGINNAALPPALMHNLAVENRFNLLRMAVGTADRIIAVSPNYAKELTEHSSLGGLMRPLLQRRAQHGTLIGITNGYDKHLLLPTQSWLSTNLKGLKFDNGKAVSRALKGLAPQWKHVQSSKAQATASKGSKAQIFGETLASAEACFVQAKQHNRHVFLQFLRQWLPANSEHVVLAEHTQLQGIEEHSPIFYTVGRLVEQKGFDQLAEAIACLLREVEAHNQQHPQHPKPLPLFVIQGSGDEKYRKALVALKEQLVATGFAHLAAPIVLIDVPDANLKNLAMACADYFMVPSKFEPCGLVQMEALAAGTPVVAMAVGGLSDTIVHQHTGFLSQGPVWFNLSNPEDTTHNAQLFYGALAQAYQTFVEESQTFATMQVHALCQNFSWALGPTQAYGSLLPS
jgi:glycogen synthase